MTERVTLNNMVQRVGLAVLGTSLALSIGEIGKRYFSGFRTEYGWSSNVFGPNEGAFFFLYLVLGGASVVLLSFAVGPYLRRAVFRSLGSRRMEPERLVLVMAVCCFLAAIFYRVVVFLEAPMTDDENAYVFAAKILASGHLALPGYPESLRPFLTNEFLIMGDRVFTQYYPGFPLVLAVPVSLGAEWIVNSLAAALGLVGTYLLGRELTEDKWVGFVASAFLFLSPSYMLTAGTLFSHPVAATWGVWGLLFVWRARSRNSWRYTVVGAGCVGMLLLTRPLSGAVCGAVAAWMLLSSPFPVRRKLPSIVTGVSVAALFVGAILAYQALTTGDPFLSGYSYFSKTSGHHISSFDGSQFTSGGWLTLLAFPFIRYNAWLFGWPISLALLPFAPKGPVRSLGLLVVVGIWCAHLPWTATGVNLTGAAHYFEAMPMLAILSAAGVLALVRSEVESRATWGLNIVVFSTILTVAVFFPWATENLNRLAKANDFAYQLVEARVVAPAIVFATYSCDTFALSRHRADTWTFRRKNNSVALDDDVIWLNDLGSRNVIAMKAFPGRRYYRLRTEANRLGQSRLNLIEIHAEESGPEVEVNVRKSPQKNDVDGMTRGDRLDLETAGAPDGGVVR